MSKKRNVSEAVLVPNGDCCEILPVFAEMSDGRKIVKWFFDDYMVEPEQGKWEVIGTFKRCWSWPDLWFADKFTPFSDIDINDI